MPSKRMSASEVELSPREALLKAALRGEERELLRLLLPP